MNHTPLAQKLLKGLLASGLVLTALTLGSGTGLRAQAPCSIVCENALPGNPSSEWDITGAGDSSIQGFATDISVNHGQIVHFKIDTDASAYRLDIYRLGYYGGLGARKIATVRPTIALPQTQPVCLSNAATGLNDCGNWAESVSWTVPANAVSGIYIAKAVRESGGTGSSHIAFVVRDDEGRSDLLFQASDTTWQAYNQYGGNSLYVGSPAGRAYKVSYNRPITTRGTTPEDWIFNAEYPMIRWLESNGYNVSYSTGVDTDRRGAELLEHKVFMSVGHDEYWSGPQRANVEAARAAGIHLAFWSGNEVFWKTRWENSIDGSNTPYRTLVTYKETHANAVIDPNDPPTWTGTWRDPRFSPPADGGRPENALTGTIFTVNGRDVRAINVPAADGKMRFWRNTSIATLAAGTTAALPAGTLGYEWDEDLDNGSRPPGLIWLSTSTYAVPSYIQDYGSTYGSGTATHHLTLYRHSSGALVLGAGTEQWPWGLDANHDFPSGAADVRMQQATVNVFADMSVQPGNLQTGLVAATASSDVTPPVSTITSPAGGATLQPGAVVTITGTATDSGGGVVGGVEVSVDGGVTWHPATGRASWSYSWTASGSGSVTIKSRAADDSANLETPSAGTTVNFPSGTCPCSVWTASTVPAGADPDGGNVEIGTRFRTSVAGTVSGIRFYKFATTTGTHTGSLWTNAGVLLATATFTGETASGWQQVNLPSPVAIAANTSYVVSYHAPVGHYAVNSQYFATSGVTSGPLTALADGFDGPNGVYRYGATAFPNQTYQSEGYWADVAFTPTGGGLDTAPPSVSAVTPVSGAGKVATAATVVATFSEPMDATTINATTVLLRDPSGAQVGATVAYNSATRTATLTPTAALAGSTTYTATVRGGTIDPRVKDVAGNAMTSNVSWSFTTVNGADATPPTVTSVTPANGTTGVSNATSVTATFSEAMTAATVNTTTFELRDPGSALVPATVSYNSATNTATLTPSAVLASSTIYTATVKGGATDPRVKDVAGNALAANFSWSFTTAVPDTTPPTVTAVSPANGATGVSLLSTVTATFSEAMDPATIGTATFELRNPASTLITATVSYNSATRIATLTPSAALANSTTYTATVKGGTVDPRAKDLAGNALAANFTWSFSTPVPDVTPPTVSSVAPAGGATGVSLTASVSATFSEAMDPTTISTTTFELRNPASTLVTATVTYNSATLTATLTPTAALATSTIYTATVKGGATDPRAKDLAGNALAANFVWSFTTAADTTPPTVSSVTPAGGATSVSTATGVSVTFSEAMDPATISNGGGEGGVTTFDLTNSAGTSVPATLTYNSATRVATLQPTAPLAGSTTYTATVKGGATDPRVKDLAGNALAANFSWSFTTMLVTACPCSIWSASTTPAGADPDSGQVEVGVKFRSDQAGTITGVRFYKFATNTGTHIGHLWSSTGTLLATATFAGETASGWQQVSFGTPVTIAANTTYVTSYHTDVGHYATNSAYFAAAGVDNPPLHALQNGVDGGNAVYSYGGNGSFPNQTYQSENYWVDVVFMPSGPDLTPPTVTSVTPGSGATAISTITAVTATFNEAMDATTISTSTFELRNPSNTLVPATVTYSSAARTATLTPSAPLSNFTVYTATVKGGATDPRVKDVAGNALAANFTWSFTTAPVSTCPCTIWTSSTTPAGADPDSSSVEVGVKFRTDLLGVITGFRFYKFANNTGTHVGHLWTSTGALLATATFTGETASGWQQVNLASPVAINLNTTYVASSFAPVGHYATNSAYFAAAGVDRAPLHALQNGVDGGNAVYGYGAGGAFPNQTFNSENYWVDVVFMPSAPDTTPPTVTAATPAQGAVGVLTTTNVTATFSEAMSATIDTTTVELRNPSGTLIPATVTYDEPTKSAILDPTAALAASTTYTATVKGGATDPRVKDLAGNAMASNFSWSFTTAAPPPPPPGDGPGGPILVVSATANPYTRYYAEILRSEGMNEFAVADISTVSATTLAAYDVVVLGEVPLTTTQVTMFSDWVNGGGRLIASRPDKKLAGLLGLTAQAPTLANGYLLVDGSTAPGAGIVTQTIQFHGTADLYTVAGATSVAMLYSTISAPTPNPAVTLISVGTNGGQAAAFTYDLARSVVYTRQGNPAWAAQERDGFVPIRSDDMFFGTSGPDWIDFNRITIPQADEQQRLLVNLILKMNSTGRPLPRFWYLPRGFKAAVVMTGDDHASGFTAAHFDSFKASSPAGCSVANWDCIRATSYMYPNSPISNGVAASYVADGFEIGVHVTTNCLDYTPASLQTFFTSQISTFVANFPSLPAATTNRTHCIAWSDYSSQPQVELSKGIRLDTTYYYWPQSWILDRPGVFTGSGMPMRFADTTGALIDVYQATTQMTDESGQTYPLHVNALLDKAIGPEGYYGVFTANMHNDVLAAPGADAIVASAKARGVPIVTARQMLAWLDGRNGSSFTGLTWNGSALSFSIAIGAGANGLQAMVPTKVAAGTLTTLTLNGSTVAFTKQTIKGIEYAIFTAAAGTYQATYAP